MHTKGFSFNNLIDRGLSPVLDCGSREELVRFTSLCPFRIQIIGRTKHFINAFGEEVVIENTDRGLVIFSKDNGTSIGYRKKGDNKWNIYTTDSKINYANETEIIMFKPGYELFYKLID